MSRLQQWRKRNDLTQVDAASLLGISQTYLSLLEKGARPLTPALRGRMQAASPQPAGDTHRAQLSALGYPAFAHVPRARPKPAPDTLLLSILTQADGDSRIVEALPWLIREYAAQMDFPWLVRQAKLHNLQNRLGFLLEIGGNPLPGQSAALRELERARLLHQDTLCWDSMPAATREWMLANRTPLAEHWNVLTRLEPENVRDAA